MTVNIQYQEGKTTGKEIRISCIRCVGKTIHKVICSFTQQTEHYDQHCFISWNVDYQIVQCQGCQTISFREASSNSEDGNLNNEGEWKAKITERLYPHRLDGRKGLDEDIYHLPNEIQLIYNETLSALSNQSPILAGIGLRTLLEAVCKEKSATGHNLLERVDNLVTRNVLTPASAAILHKIRTLGNSAAHEVKPHTEKQLAVAMDVVEHLLRDVYILPKQVESEFE